MTANRSPACASKLLYRPALLPDALVAQHAYFGTRQVTDEQVIPLLARDLEIGPYLDLVGPGPGASWTEIDGHAVLRPSLELSGAVALRNHYQAFLKENLTILLTHLDRLLALVEAERKVPDPVGGN